MESLGAAADVLSIVSPTLRGVQHLRDDIGRIRGAPDAIRSLEDDLTTVTQALESFQALPNPQLQSLGGHVVSQSKFTLELCSQSCKKFRAALGRWTRNSSDGGLSWRDQAVLGLFKQGQMRSMSEQQLHNCRTNLITVVTIASLHSSLQQKDVSSEIIATVSAKESEVTDAIALLERQMSDMNAKLELYAARRRQHESETDRTEAVEQALLEQRALNGSHELLRYLLSGMQSAASSAQSAQAGARVRFGDHNKGSQVGVNHGGLSNTFHSRD